jgi:multiple sugar transport system substrate-binding protein
MEMVLVSSPALRDNDTGDHRRFMAGLEHPVPAVMPAGDLPGMETMRINKSLAIVLFTLPLATSLVLAACTGAAATAIPASPVSTLPAAQGAHAPGVVILRWFIGLGTGSAPFQMEIEQSVAEDFNNAQDRIQLMLEVLPNESARDILATEISSGAAPDVIGPVGWAGANSFADQWLDLSPYIQSSGYDSGKFDPALVRMYQTDQGLVGLPIAAFPSAIYYNTGLFSEAGLNPPPARYGEQYQMPDGSLQAWNWDTLTRLAKLLTLDANGRHSGEAGFDASHIMQYGFTFQWEVHVEYWGAFMSNGGQLLASGGTMGSYRASIPEMWKQAWKWVYDGMWGSEPFIPTYSVEYSDDYLNSNSFASGRIAMVEMPVWYLCCLMDLVNGGGEFDFAAMPISLDGKVAGRIDADTFRIWKGTKHPAEAFTALAYLVDSGIQKLVVGSPAAEPAYGAIPSIHNLLQPWLSAKKASFPFVKHWDVLLAGLNYPDIPSAEGFQPNMKASWDRTGTFTSLLQTTGGLDLEAQEAMLEKELTAIYNR